MRVWRSTRTTAATSDAIRYRRALIRGGRLRRGGLPGDFARDVDVDRRGRYGDIFEATLASSPATKALDPDPFPRHSLRQQSHRHLCGSLRASVALPPLRRGRVPVCLRPDRTQRRRPAPRSARDRSDLGWISGVAFLGTLTRSAGPVQGFTFVRCCSMPPASLRNAASLPPGLPFPAVADRLRGYLMPWRRCCR